MSMPNDKQLADIEQWENEQRNQRITDKFNRMLSQAEQRILQQVAPIQEKVDEHDGFISNFAKSFSHVAGFLQRATGKKL